MSSVAAEPQASGPVCVAVLLSDGPERDRPGDRLSPKTGDLDGMQILVNGTGTGWREVHGVRIIAVETQYLASVSLEPHSQIVIS